MHVYVKVKHAGKNSNIKQVTTLPVDFIMHEHLHKYSESIKKLEKKSHM